MEHEDKGKMIASLTRVGDSQCKVFVSGDASFEELCWYLGQMTNKVATEWAARTGMEYSDSLEALLTSIASQDMQDHHHAEG